MSGWPTPTSSPSRIPPLSDLPPRGLGSFTLSEGRRRGAGGLGCLVGLRGRRVSSRAETSATGTSHRMAEPQTAAGNLAAPSVITIDRTSPVPPVLPACPALRGGHQVGRARSDQPVRRPGRGRRPPDTKVIRNEVTPAVRGQVLLARRHRRALEQVARRAARAGLNGGASPVTYLARCCSPPKTWCCAMGRACARPGRLR